MNLPDMVYYVVASDGPGRWLTIAVAVGGGASVVGRWATQEAAAADAVRWWTLESAATSWPPSTATP